MVYDYKQILIYFNYNFEKEKDGQSKNRPIGVRYINFYLPYSIFLCPLLRKLFFSFGAQSEDFFKAQKFFLRGGRN